MNEQVLNDIVKLCSEIISNERIGSRYEGSDVTKIWFLGDKIIKEIKPLNISVLLTKLNQLHNLKNIRYDYRLYKAAIIFRKYWEKESDYLKTAQKLNAWTRLREIYPICDNILSGKSHYDRSDLDKLVERCKDLTYEEVRTERNKFISRDDYLLSELGLDKYDFSDKFMELYAELEKIVENEDINCEMSIRQNYSPENLKNMRLLLSALQKDEIYNKYLSDIKKIGKKFPEKDSELIKRLNNLFMNILGFIHNQKVRMIIREEVPITFIGNFSTFLRAIESDKNKEQYKKNKEILNKFLGSLKS